MAKPQIYLGSAHIVYYTGQYLSEIKYCSPSRADPVVVFHLCHGAHHKKPHSSTHPRSMGMNE